MALLTTNGMSIDDLTAAPNGPGLAQQLGNQVDLFYGRTVANVAALPATGNFSGQRIWVTAIKMVAVWDGSGWALTGRAPSATATATAVQSLTNGAETVIAFASASGDATMWNAGTPNRLIAPVAGVYMAVLGYSFASSATGSRIVAPKVNGGAGLPSSAVAGAGVAVAFSGTLTHVLSLAANDYVGFSQFQSSGGALNTHTQSYPFMSLTRVGAA